MNFKEQFSGILKAAPHLPIQSFNGLALLIAIPILTIKLFELGLSDWIETTATANNYSSIQERIRDEEQEYFCTIEYVYFADDQQLTFKSEKINRTKSLALHDLKGRKKNSKPISIWYDNSDPSNIEFEDVNSRWIIYLGIIILFILLLAYFRWVLLKYYELELKELKKPNYGG